ncbi:PREDICTED: transmembrane protein 170B [Elephantulus edwardii]|uniref:transmembrane protein 170B n=1 Tax=Elephantulus edwardii TaxID=28737 RepID=UPI0003F0B87B|nr:PREDICTED: transmembrane protein 170B [Elephantulus edwardii]
MRCRPSPPGSGRSRDGRLAASTERAPLRSARPWSPGERCPRCLSAPLGRVSRGARSPPPELSGPGLLGETGPPLPPARSAALPRKMWYWIFLWALFSSLFVHGAAGVLMFVMLQRHRQGRVISVIAISIGFLASVTGAMITSAAVAGIYRVAGKNMAPLEALVWGVGQTVLTLIISFSRILATL